MSKAKDLATFAPDIGESIAKAVKAAEKKSKLESIVANRKADASAMQTTGCLCLDYIMGGGIPSGKIIGISGDEHLGKSVLATQITAEQLREGLYAVLFDAEGTNDPVFLQKRGIDFSAYRGKRNKKGDLKPGEKDRVWFYQPHTGDELKYFVHTLCSGLPENRDLRIPPLIFTLDSVISLIEATIWDGSSENNTAMHARMYAEILPIIAGNLIQTGASFIYTNQIRDDVGGAMTGFGGNDKEPAGRALKFFSSVRIRLGKTKPKHHKDKPHPFIDGFIENAKPKAGGVWQEGHTKDNPDILDRYRYTSMNTIKNKVYSPFKSGWMRIMFEEAEETGSGIDPVFDIFTLLLELDLIKKGKNKQTYVLNPNDDVPELKDLIPDEFNYYEIKKHIKSAGKPLVKQMRDMLLVSGYAYQGCEIVENLEEEEVKQ